MKLCYEFIPPSKTIQKNLDSSYIWDCFGREKVCLITEEIQYISVVNHVLPDHSGVTKIYEIIKKSFSITRPVCIQDSLHDSALPFT